VVVGSRQPFETVAELYSVEFLGLEVSGKVVFGAREAFR
jgi:hypothetical protein